MKAISETLGLEPDRITKATDWDRGLQCISANYYPPCSKPDQAIGLAAHTDPNLLNLIIQNDVGGLQIQHKGKWVIWKAEPNALIVDLGDQIQVPTHALICPCKFFYFILLLLFF